MLRKVISLAGDAATNSMVVMAMVGALVGIHQVPTDMLSQLLDFDCSSDQVAQQRPSFLSVRENALNNIEALISLRPQEKLEIVEDGKTQAPN